MIFLDSIKIFEILLILHAGASDMMAKEERISVNQNIILLILLKEYGMILK
jgi:hypothetical protein